MPHPIKAEPTTQAEENSWENYLAISKETVAERVSKELGNALRSVFEREANSGDVSPRAQDQFDTALHGLIDDWVRNNVTKPLDTADVYEYLLGLVHPLDQHRLSHEYPGFIDVQVNEFLTFGFDQEGGEHSWRCCVKNRENEGESLADFDLPCDIHSAKSIATAIMSFARLCPATAIVLTP